MVVATATATGGASSLRYSFGSDHRRLRPANKLMGFTKFDSPCSNCLSSTRVKGYFHIRALDPQREEAEENSSVDNNSSSFNSQDDLEYLVKLVAGSFVGAALIKYGSIVFPDVTRPNIIEALIMILTPVIVAIFLLIKQSRAEGRS